jgi:hypothetical protein
MDFTTKALKIVTYLLRTQTRRKDQVDFTSSRVTYILRMHRQGERSDGVHGNPEAPTIVYCIHMCTLLSANCLQM